ncbi:hypothetical protein [Serratia fonticola]|uniref:hypothetical protein n=1 Tax=Serratia fonticola TaxID=47917 RepID=UPI0027FCBB10|nr:hypothetical protein [Serratia fonticola]MDQ7208686.1 hypothetical protein [Serratia fonticola]HBE9083045.1 hypothetical protein [Serratia fonticola]HBE9093548.1 hypothetical protein [Serratia fonticola]HBE9151972.1 hypothetical protein [Serratia fonticola]
MNRYIFKKNLLCSIDDLFLMEHLHSIDSNELLFAVVPVFEEGKRYNSKDELMQRTVFSNENIHGKIIGINDVVDVFSGLDPLFPLWVKISLKKNKPFLIELQTSVRFRNPSVVMNTESKYPPFFIGNGTAPE